MNPLLDRITIEPGKAGGRPCLRGLRMRVQDVLEMLAAGMTSAEIVAEYSYLELDDIRAAWPTRLRPWQIRLLSPLEVPH